MSRFSDRFWLLLLAEIGLGGFLLAILAGAAQYWYTGRTLTLALLGLAGLFVLAMIGTYVEFAHLDKKADQEHEEEQQEAAQ